MELDPSEWPLVIKLLAGWGPLGIGWIWSERRRAAEARDHHATRTAHEAAITATETRHDVAMAAKDEVHSKQLQQVYDRMFRLVQEQSRASHRLADGVTERIKQAKEEP